MRLSDRCRLPLHEKEHRLAGQTLRMTGVDDRGATTEREQCAGDTDAEKRRIGSGFGKISDRGGVEPPTDVRDFRFEGPVTEKSTGAVGDAERKRAVRPQSCPVAVEPIVEFSGADHAVGRHPMTDEPDRVS